MKWSTAGEGSEWLATALIGRGGLLVFASFALDKHPPACRGCAMRPAPSPCSLCLHGPCCAYSPPARFRPPVSSVSHRPLTSTEGRGLHSSPLASSRQDSRNTHSRRPRPTFVSTSVTLDGVPAGQWPAPFTCQRIFCPLGDECRPASPARCPLCSMRDPEIVYLLSLAPAPPSNLLAFPPMVLQPSSRLDTEPDYRQVSAVLTRLVLGTAHQIKDRHGSCTECGRRILAEGSTLSLLGVRTSCGAGAIIRWRKCEQFLRRLDTCSHPDKTFWWQYWYSVQWSCAPSC